MGLTLVITASVPLGVGLVMGALVAIVGMFIAPDMPGMAELAGRAYWLLAVLLPLGLWLGIVATYADADHEAAYRTLGRALFTAVQAALVGGGLGAGPFYLLVVTYLPVVLGDYDVVTWSLTLRERLFWGPWLWIVGITVLASLPLAYWSHRASHR